MDDQNNIEPDGMDEIMAAKGTPTNDSPRPSHDGPAVDQSGKEFLDRGKGAKEPNQVLKLLGAGTAYMNNCK